VLNVIFINFLIYKSLIVHEVTQFVSYLSKPESAFNHWESWRRSRQSVTKPVRSIYTISLALLPVFISVLIMFILGLYIFGDSQASAEKINQLEPSKFVVSGEHLAAVFQKAKYSYWFVAVLHLVPLYFFYHNVGPTNKRWAKINKLRGSESAFKELSAETLASSTDRPDGMIRLYDKEKGDFLGEITEKQLKFLTAHLTEENETDQDYFIDSSTLDLLKEEGADAKLISILSKALSGKPGAEIR
jgi:hypothetical protein